MYFYRYLYFPLSWACLFSFSQHSIIYFLDDGFLNGLSVLNSCCYIKLLINSSRIPIDVKIDRGKYLKYVLILTIYYGLILPVGTLVIYDVCFFVSLGLRVSGFFYLSYYQITVFSFTLLDTRFYEGLFDIILFWDRFLLSNFFLFFEGPIL